MEKATLLLTILLCFVFNASAQRSVTLEEYEVYKAWLEKAFITPETRQLFIIKQTTDFIDDFYELPLYKRRQLHKLQSSTLRNYRLRNRKSLELKNNFDVKPIVNLIIDEDPASHLDSNSPYLNLEKEFGAEYRITLSRVGFNKNKNQALIHVNFRNNSIQKYTFGYFFLLSKKDGNWITKQTTRSWEY